MISDYVVLVIGLLSIGLIPLLYGRRSLPLPPGPRGLPFIGNLLDMPSKQTWKVFAQWSEKRGDIISLNILGQNLIIIHSVKIAVELLEKRSTNYSDRPVLMMGGEIVGWKNTLALMPYGPRFREFRKLLFRTIGTRANVKRFHPLIEEETQKFLRRVVTQSHELTYEIKKTAAAIILLMSYGYKIKDHNDPIVQVVDTAVDQFSEAMEPGKFLVDVVPALRYVPAWFPGAGWKKTADRWAQMLTAMADMPHEFVKEQMVAGTALSSFSSNLLAEKDLNPETEFNIKWSAASLYSAGSDTTVSTLNTFFLAMSLHPEVQKKAQAELDAVVGTDRLPNLADREHLPYVESVVMEVLRWNPVGPLGLPHCVVADDVYEGYFIPKGSYVIANVWKMLHDPEVYLNPLSFNPDRFMGPEPESEPRSVCFGFGRRICPGLNFADASIFISCAMSLAVFNISKGLNEKGVEIEPDLEYTNTTIRSSTLLLHGVVLIADHLLFVMMTVTQNHLNALSNFGQRDLLLLCCRMMRKFSSPFSLVEFSQLFCPAPFIYDTMAAVF